MTPYNQTPDDRLKDVLRSRFDEFEPEAPEVLGAILGKLESDGLEKRKLPAFASGLVAFVLLLVSYTLDSPYVREGASQRGRSDFLSVSDSTQGVIANRHQTGELPVSVSLQSRRSVSHNLPPGLPLEKLTARGSRDNEGPDSERGELAAASEMPDCELLSALTVHLPVNLSIPAIDASDVVEPIVIPRIRGKVHLMGEVGVNHTQYIMTVLPMGDRTIRDVRLASPGNATTWRPGFRVGVEYKNWQVRAAYEEFTQKTEFAELSGDVSVVYKPGGDYNLNLIERKRSVSSDFRLLGLAVRRVQPIASKGYYFGAGAGYQVELKGRQQGIWGQAFLGKAHSISPKLDLYMETQLNYSFQAFEQNDPALRFKPYQIGLSAGVRINR